MMKSIVLCVIGFLLLHTDNHASAYVVDFSKDTWPHILLKVEHLEMEREELTYGDKVVPKRNGLIELRCFAAKESFLSSIGPELAKNVTGVKWVLPNPNMLTEHRAYIKGGEYEPELEKYLVITDFNKDTDAGDFTCQLSFEDETITRYNEKITIPSLDGAPIVHCELRCKRNYDEHCQLMEGYDVDCKTFSATGRKATCHFHPCDEEGTCLLPYYEVQIGWVSHGFDGPPTPMYHLEHSTMGGLASRSGYITCGASHYRGSTNTQLFMHVSVGEVKTGGVRLVALMLGPDGVPVQPPPPPKPDFLGGHYETYAGMSPRPWELGCWTTREVKNFEWTFRPIAHQEATVVLTNRTGFSISSHEVLGGLATVLHIDDVTMEHGGFYSCEATNDIQETLLTVEEFKIPGCVWAEDANMNQKTTLRRSQEGSVTLKCTMKSTTKPFVYWYKKNPVDAAMAVLRGNPKYEFFQDDQVMVIHNLTMEDSGIYECSVNMNGHSMGGEVTLQVEEFPIDAFEQIEKLHDALESLKHVGAKIGGIIHSLVPDGHHDDHHADHHGHHGDHGSHHDDHHEDHVDHADDTSHDGHHAHHHSHHGPVPRHGLGGHPGGHHGPSGALGGHHVNQVGHHGGPGSHNDDQAEEDSSEEVD